MGKVTATTVTGRYVVPDRWTVRSYPSPDPELAPLPHHLTEEAPERLYWASDGTVAFNTGKRYPIDQAHLLVTLDELMGTNGDRTE